MFFILFIMCLAYAIARRSWQVFGQSFAGIQMRSEPVHVSHPLRRM